MIEVEHVESETSAFIWNYCIIIYTTAIKETLKKEMNTLSSRNIIGATKLTTLEIMKSIHRNAKRFGLSYYTDTASIKVLPLSIQSQ